VFDPRQRQRTFPLTSASRPALGPTQPPILWVPGALSPGVKRGRGVMLTTHPLLVPRLRKSRSCTSSHPNAPLWSVTGPLYFNLLLLGTVSYPSIAIICRRKIFQDRNACGVRSARLYWNRKFKQNVIQFGKEFFSIDEFQNSSYNKDCFICFTLTNTYLHLEQNFIHSATQRRRAIKDFYSTD
jgi:hypothetical protein